MKGTKIPNLSGNESIGSFLCWERPGQRGHADFGGPGQTCEPDATVTRANVQVTSLMVLLLALARSRKYRRVLVDMCLWTTEVFSSTECAWASVNGGCSRFCFWSYPVVSALSHICGCCFNLWVNLKAHQWKEPRCGLKRFFCLDKTFWRHVPQMALSAFQSK